jgi:hypothetical protein
MPRVTTPAGRTRTVKNLSWFLRKARGTSLRSLVMTHHGDGYVMEAVFDDGHIFVTPYASLSVFKQVMGRQRSLAGQAVAVVDGGHVHEITLGAR